MLLSSGIEKEYIFCLELLIKLCKLRRTLGVLLGVHRAGQLAPVGTGFLFFSPRTNLPELLENV